MCNDSRQDKEFTDKLKRAVNSGDIVTFRRLVKGGVNINSKFWYNSTLLHEAVSTGNVDIVKILLQNKADIDASNSDGRTALHIASRAGQEEIVILLIKHGTDVNAQTLDGQTSLHLAVWRGRQNIVQRLVSAGADVNIRDKDGWSPLYWAAKLNYMDIVTCFVERGAEIDCRIKNGSTPLLQSIRNGHHLLAKYLILQGADYYMKSQGESVVATLMKNVHLTAEQIVDTTDFLIKAGYNIQKDDWLRKWKLPARIANHKDFMSWLQNCLRVVPSLTCICRTKIRQCLKQRVDGRSIAQLIPSLPLPNILIDFIEIQK